MEGGVVTQILGAKSQASQVHILIWKQIKSQPLDILCLESNTINCLPEIDLSLAQNHNESVFPG